jgi:hypothetical protein
VATDARLQSGLQPHQATLEGTVNPNGVDTHYYFQYGTTTSYGSFTPETDAGSGRTNEGKRASIVNLPSGTFIHYRIVASSVGGTSYGEPMTFMTPNSSFTGSSLADLVMCNNNDEYAVAVSNGTELGSSTGLWSKWGCNQHAVVGDFAGNGKDDVALPSEGNVWNVALSTGSSFEGPGSGTWLTGWTSDPSWIGEGDFTGDGKDDLVMCNNNDEYAVAISNGTAFGASGTGVWSKWGCNRHAVVGDFTGDGEDDIAVPNESNGTWAVGVSNGSDNFEAAGSGTWLTGWTASPAWAATGDFTGDGEEDLITCEKNEYAVAVSNGKELGASGSGIWLHAPCKTHAVIGDFNGDGKDDIAIPNESNNSWTVELSTGTQFGAAGSGTWLSGWTAKPSWADVGEGSNSEWTNIEGSWATEATPDATGAPNNRLTGISCTSSTFCFASAYEIYDGVSYGYGESWNGSIWTTQGGLEPSEGIQLAGVSCTSATACTAVGSLTEGNGDVTTAAERWNGTKWSRQTTPNATGAPNNRLTSVSCTSSTFCLATAYEVYGGVSYAYGESWNGSEWKIQSPESNAGIQFAGVSCTSATLCTAVGSLTETGGNIVTLAYSWNGSKWSRQTSPDEPTTVNQFASVSCIATACTAVGSDTNDKGVWNFAATTIVWSGLSALSSRSA